MLERDTPTLDAPLNRSVCQNYKMDTLATLWARLFLPKCQSFADGHNPATWTFTSCSLVEAAGDRKSISVSFRLTQDEALRLPHFGNPAEPILIAADGAR